MAWPWSATLKSTSLSDDLISKVAPVIDLTKQGGRLIRDLRGLRRQRKAKIATDPIIGLTRVSQDQIKRATKGLIIARMGSPVERQRQRELGTA